MCMRNVDIAALVKAKWCNQASARNVIFDQMLRRNAPVSYTHLTLPTNREV